MTYERSFSYEFLGRRTWVVCHGLKFSFSGQVGVYLDQIYSNLTTKTKLRLAVSWLTACLALAKSFSQMCTWLKKDVNFNILPHMLAISCSQMSRLVLTKDDVDKKINTFKNREVTKP